jgi:hypothetical protein
LSLAGCQSSAMHDAGAHDGGGGGAPCVFRAQAADHPAKVLFAVSQCP